MIEADVAMFDQTVMNLCLNARDAMPKGGTLTLETSVEEFDDEKCLRNPESRAGRYVCLRITDTGCGMDANVLKHLFEPFFTTKDHGKGTGLGLASAYGIVRQHQGWMEVESVLDRGTSFRIYLPRIPKTKTVRLALPKTHPPRGRNETVMLVEDEIALREVAVDALILFGYRVLPASNGEEALKLWKQHHGAIDLVLTDMKMPKGLSGLELAEKLWRMKPSLKIIIMSGYSLEMVRESTIGVVGYTFLAKPFELRVLAETVRHCLDKVP
jgi:two-component system cell cycle sensor histidine kinase/response regulator CckA